MKERTHLSLASSFILVLGSAVWGQTPSSTGAGPATVSDRVRSHPSHGDHQASGRRSQWVFLAEYPEGEFCGV